MSHNTTDMSPTRGNYAGSVKFGDIVYSAEFISCKKKNCNGCPHGPYWYARFQSKKGPRVVYIGKKFKQLDFDNKKQFHFLTGDAAFNNFFWEQYNEYLLQKKESRSENTPEMFD